MQALVRTESGGRALAIGMDKGQSTTTRQPESPEEAVAMAKALAAAGRKFSVGLAQIHVSNVAFYGLTWEQAFDACQNLAIGQKILWNFFHRASANGYTGVAAIWAALRGYNSGSVDRSISDDYASRIFAYMSSAPAQVQLGRGIAPGNAAGPPSNPATTVSTQARSSAKSSTNGTEPQVDVALLEPATTAKPALRPGESPEIFEKPGAKAGF
jgi:type IV secretion system protein VirB1